MSDVNLIMDPEQLKELRAQLLKLKKEIENVNQQIAQSIMIVSQTWKDFKFKDFQTTYKNYQTGITKFETDLEKVSNETLPPLIKAAEDYLETVTTS